MAASEGTSLAPEISGSVRVLMATERDRERLIDDKPLPPERAAVPLAAARQS